MLTVVDDLIPVYYPARSAAKRFSRFEDDAVYARRLQCYRSSHARIASSDDGNRGLRDYRIRHQVATQVRHAIHNLRIGVKEIRCVST